MYLCGRLRGVQQRRAYLLATQAVDLAKVVMWSGNKAKRLAGAHDHAGDYGYQNDAQRAVTECIGMAEHRRAN